MRRETALNYAKDDLWSTHLGWMLENKPDLVRRLFEKDRNQLLLYLSRKVKQALSLWHNLQEKNGLPPNEIEEIVLAEVITPPPPDDIPEPLPEPLVDRVRIWAENLTECNQTDGSRG